MTLPPDARPMPGAGPGFYVDSDGAMHINAAELCQRLGLPPTDRNQDRVAHDAARMLAQLAPDMHVEVRDG